MVNLSVYANEIRVMNRMEEMGKMDNDKGRVCTSQRRESEQNVRKSGRLMLF